MHDAAHILFIDDDASMLQMVKDILSLTPCTFTGFKDYHQGLRHVVDQPPDLILLDVHMGDINGVDLLRQFRKMTVTEKTPVIMLTGDSQISTVKAASQVGISGYLLKPFKPGDLIKTIEKALNRSVMSPLKQTQLQPDPVGNTRAATQKISLPSQRLMVIDDDTMMHELIGDILKDSNLAVENHLNPNEALRAIMLKAPDVVLSDVNMPGLSGVELARQLKKMRSTYRMPVVLMSGQELSQLPQELQQLEVEGFLTKPFTPMELVKTLQPFFKVAIF